MLLLSVYSFMKYFPNWPPIFTFPNDFLFGIHLLSKITYTGASYFQIQALAIVFLSWKMRINSFLKLANFFFKLYIWLHQASFVAHRIFSCSMWDLIPWPGIEPSPPASGVQCLSHWTTS